MDERRPRKTRRLVAAAVALVLLIAGGVWYANKVREDRRREAAAAAAELARLNNLGLGRLENALAAQAVEPFETITRRRPDLALGPRNLTVARLVDLAGGTQSDAIRPGQPEPALVAAANEALESLRRVEPESVFTPVLASRIAAASGDLDAARAALVEAVKRAPDLAWVRYEQYRLDRNARTDEQRQAAQDALAAAYEAEPRNVWITVVEYPVLLAERRDPAIVEVLATARELLRPFAEGITQRTRTDVLDLIDQAATAAQAGDWAAASRNARVVANLVRPEEVAQADLARVNLNTLEFVAVDFPPEFYEAAGLERRPAPEAIPVEFAPGLAGIEEVAADGVAGLLVEDFDLDGSLDVARLHAGGLTVTNFAGDGAGDLIRYDIPEGLTSLIAADLDSDADAGKPEGAGDQPCHAADLDVAVYGPGGLRVLENRRGPDGNRSLVPVELPEPLASLTGVLAAAFADFDLDGDLDLVVSAESGVSLWATVAGLKFEDRTPRSELPGSKPTVILPVDLDRDVDLDLILAGGDGPAGLLENLRHGNLRWRPFEAGKGAEARAVELIDADGNASWDLLVADEGGLSLLLTQTAEPGRWTVRSVEKVAEGTSDRLWQLDYDNDGLPDLLARSADGKPVLLRNAGGRFEPTEALSGFDGTLVAADYGDLDTDGDLDLALATSGEIRLLENRGGNANRWIDVALLAQQVKEGSGPSQSGRVNHQGVGSLLELKTGPLYQPAVVRKPVTHFGLGSATTPDVLRVIWTNGIPENVLEPEPKAFLCEREDPKGSCPYLYTFDGERFVFSTDLCWAAPIGLVYAEGVPVPTRAWEYPMITTPLRPDASGRYVLQITEELWEAAYFDQVELIAVDHPPGVQVFTNEKVGPPEAVSPRLHTAVDPRPPVAARDGHGRDVLSQIAGRDGRFVKAFDRRYMQGVCEPHAVELDFGDLGGAERVTLFLTGWMLPTDTSINVALGQNAEAPKPKPPSLSVPNEQGEWVEVLPNMGFPGGKTKPIAVDLTGKFLCDDRRVRIETSMEIYWDAAFVTVDEPAVAVVTRVCPLASADLHYRGVSARSLGADFGPSRYDYDRVLDAPAWPPMRGAFTRYGDVTDLLRRADDAQAVLGAGDEMTLRFESPGDPPAGWTRSFLLHNVGYNKDADLNTVYGQSSEPLPFGGMASYPYAGAASFPDTPEHRRYLDEYQTRTQPSRTFWTAVRDYGE